MSIETRLAKAEDKERCLELLEGLLGRDRSTEGSPSGDVFDRLLCTERGEVLLAVAEGHGKVLGFASVSYNLAMRYGGEYCQLEELIVDPSARGRNVGGLLVASSMERARQRGCAEYGLYLVESTENSLPFYEKYGFRKVGSELRRTLS